VASRRCIALSSLGFLAGGCLVPTYNIDPTLDPVATGGAGGASSAGAASGGASAAGAAATGAAVAGAAATGAAGAGAPTGGMPGVGGALGKAGAGAIVAGAPGAGASAGGAGGAPSNGGSCADEVVGAGGKASAVPATTAIVVFDNVVIRDAANTSILFQWQFADGTTIADTTTDPRPPDKWSRSQFFGDANKVSRAPGAHSTFLACDGTPAIGSLKNIIPFTAAGQYYEASALFAEHDYSGATVSANVKLVVGGAEDVTCPAHALLYAIGGGVETPGTPLTLLAGAWEGLSLTIPATGFSKVEELGIRVTTYPCQ
jgi:hypothetical protein